MIAIVDRSLKLWAVHSRIGVKALGLRVQVSVACVRLSNIEFFGVGAATREVL